MITLLFRPQTFSMTTWPSVTGASSLTFLISSITSKIRSLGISALRRTLASGSEVKGLWNHDTNLALGSLTNRTLILEQDDIGLRGTIVINPYDSDAVNAYQRVKRGDVSGCSFGFDVSVWDDEYDADGHRHTTLREIFPLYEVSPCTFPAYEATEVYARNREAFQKDKLRRAHEFEKWRADILRRIKK